MDQIAALATSIAEYLRNQQVTAIAHQPPQTQQYPLSIPAVSTTATAGKEATVAW